MTVAPLPPELHAVAAPPTASIDEREVWRQFADATTLRDVATHWLSLMRLRLQGARAASVFRVDAASGAIETLAGWPKGDQDEIARLASAAEALAQRVPLILSAAHGFHLAFASDGSDPWIVVVETATQPAQTLQHNLDELRWGTGWLLARSVGMEAGSFRAYAEDLELAARLSENVARESDVSKATSALASGLAAIFATRSVTVGVLRRRQLIVTARQRDDGVDQMDAASTNELVEVMNAALSSGRTLVVAPIEAQAPIEKDNAFDVFAARGAACVLLLAIPEKKLGVVVLERNADRPFTSAEVETLEAIATQVAPLIEAKPLLTRAPVTAERRALVAIFGPVRLKLKLVLIALLALGVVMLGATDAYVVPARALVEGGDAQVVYMPPSGAIATIAVRRGDTVRKGQLLAKVNDRDASDERGRLVNARTQIEQVLKEAKDIRDRAASEALEPKLAELAASIASLDERLARAAIVSPVDGVVMSGRAFDAPAMTLRAGEAAFVVVPSEGYRLILWVDERELIAIREGLDGRAYFAEIPSEILFGVKRVTGVKQVLDGQQWVRVEAQLQTFNDRTRPGLSGNATIDAGRKKLAWIWWHRLSRSFERRD